MPSSEVHRLEILPALSNAPARTAASENDSNDTISILEQGYIILVSGRILLGSPSGSAMSFSGADHQELSLAFFDGQTWFPFIQSSQNGTSSTIAGPKAGSFGPTTPVGTFLDPGNNILLNPHPFDSGLVKRATLGDAASVQMRLRDQGVFRALAIAHLPRIVAQDYLPLKYIILIAVGISLGLIFFIILGAFLYVWLKGRLSKGGPTKRPKLGSSFMEDGYAGHGIRNVGTDPLGLRQGTTFASDADFKSEKVGSLFKSKKNGLGNSSANLASLSISCAAIESANNSYRPNSTIAETTDALVTEFVRNHQQQLAGEPSASSEQQQQEEKSGPVAPPSPDRRSKRPLKCKPQNQNSSSSDLTNPVAQAGRFPTLLAVGYNPSTPNSNAPTSPVTTMSTPRDITGASTAAVGAEASNMNDTNNPAAAAAVPGGVFYYAKYPFRAREIGELGFQAGARILVVDMSDDIWWMGVVQNANGQQMHGVFPSNYVGPTP
ncbi:hypothetical protein BC939DRAFT_439159 [Gamsiella multidivaricata]|uniref:uncharacterized protein n=1 Tax=Gamsiella multidivaricata TaxID=101098 RepID=UPI00221F7B89|nr:uncharacterized protein BC939DRAFT_439159 [Gamsiella multidivaricata]KAI7830378.1 hypothetical protein BC939DRAFT_439159 [Gamsiella multidivaricata]